MATPLARAARWLLPLLVPLALWASPATAASGVRAAEPADRAETARAHALFERFWQESAERFPEWATFRGDHRYDDRLDDASEAGVAAADAWEREMLAAARAIRRDALSATDRTSLDLFIERGERRAALKRFDGWRRLSLGSLWGFQSLLPGLLRAMAIRDAPRAEMALARLQAWPRRTDQEIARVRVAADAGWVTARPVLERTLAQIDAQLAAPLKDGPFLEPFAQLKDPALLGRITAAIETQVLPAQRRLRRFVAEELLPRAPAAGGLARYPDGRALYAELVRDHTTTDLSPQQVHALGLRELARIRAGMVDVQRAMKVDGSFADFLAHLNGPQYRYASAEAMLEGYRAIAKRIDPEMPRLFAELPRAPYGIRPMPAFLGPGAADNYSGPPADGSAPGWFNANVESWRSRPRWALPTLIAHEAMPGHHLQNARAREIGNLPAFRSQGHYTAYGEGWALYAETLGDTIGLYERPEDRFGHLQAQALRAARLVVDTGLHAFDWTREQAVAFMREQTGETEDFVQSEVDRYLSIPGQALAYMIGQLKIVELRDRARARLGDRFDLRRFHNALLDQGALPLSVLERSIDEWIEAERAR